MTHDPAPPAERPVDVATDTSARPVRSSAGELRVRRPRPSTPGEDRYHVLLRNLRITGRHATAPRALGVTRLPGCGSASVVATNLAWTLAQTVAQPVLLVGACPTNRVVDDTFRGRERRKIISLYTVLRDELPLGDAVVPTNCAHLSVILSGSSVVTSADLGGLQRFPNLLEDMRHNYEYVIIDLPPANELTPCYDIAASLDGIVLEVESDRVCANKSQQVLRDLQSLGIPVLGAVLKEM